MDTILLTSAGGLTGVFLAKHYRSTRKCRIIATDMSKFNPLDLWTDAFYEVPAIKDPTYAEKLQLICEKESVDLIIPVTSRDVDFFSGQEIQKRFRDQKYMVSDGEINKILSNKLLCYDHLGKMGIRTPRVYDREGLVFPCVLKPQKGSGSKGTYILETMEDYEYLIKKESQSIVVEFFEGTEYTVDCLFDQEGRSLGNNVRKRIKTVSGGATISQNDPSVCVKKVIEALEKCPGIRGPLNFQFKLVDGEVAVFDVNTRFASGGLPLSVRSGFDIPNRLIELLKGDSVEKWSLPKGNEDLMMIRYYQEHFVDEKGIC